jgi:hypothetical protein
MSSALDPDLLSIGASHRRVKKVEFNPEWKCEFCSKVFTSETYFMRHSCREKIRYEELSTPIGQAAYMFYCDWMKYYKRKAPSKDTFGTSRYYGAFIAFAQHVKKLNLSNPDKFLELMCSKDISPMLWRRDQCYSMYLEWVDKKQDPLEHVKTSIETLLDVSEAENVELSDVFVYLGEKKICELIKLRKLSPWFLFCSKKFTDFLKTISKEESIEMSAVINPTYWTAKLQENKSLVKQIVEINRDMGL